MNETLSTIWYQLCFSKISEEAKQNVRTLKMLI